eukprot:TRINITY_DN10025_c0_g2_i2.p1 TRINITY_DN10025_c0_g2~~TRINITY_DN10025_c0_g2_i2.p1  ORF type:complete len:696 (+),score=174.53 TRINITY_DN10025_c0_g2_i2:126-2213(+)
MKVASLGAGDYFGEQALLKNTMRTATITAATPLTALKITTRQFKDLGLMNKLAFPQRKAVPGGNAREPIVKTPTFKTAAERAFMQASLKNNDNLCHMVTLGDVQLNSLIDAAWEEDVPACKEIITEGDDEADYFYIVKSGAFEVLLKHRQGGCAEVAASEAAEKPQTYIQPGGSFGELALLYYAPRAATVRAKVDAEVWVIDRTTFKHVVKESNKAPTENYVKVLQRIPFLEELNEDEKYALATAMVEFKFSKDELILQQGDRGQTCYILVDGECEVEVDGQTKGRMTGTQEDAVVFGERALLRDEPRAATVRVVSEAAKTLAIDRSTFFLLMRRGDDGANDDDGMQMQVLTIQGKTTIGAKAPDDHRRGRPVILPNDLTKLALLGCGGFGAVELCEHNKTKQTYALKTLNKGFVVKTGSQLSVMQERNIQLCCRSPFIAALYETYNGSHSLYFVLELCIGGELYATYNRKDFYGSERHTKYYAAAVVFALEHLHPKRIVYRDLKPENLLITRQGHLKLTDFGLATVVIGKTYTTCGTPNYFAPEIIASTGHTFAVDWWTLGVLLFELMAGSPPFEATTPMQIYRKIHKGFEAVSFPARCRGALETLIRGLCKADPGSRLPMKLGATENIKYHHWYRGFNWTAMSRLELRPPYLPIVKNGKDSSNFHARKEDMPPPVPYVDDESKWDKDFATVIA